MTQPSDTCTAAIDPAWSEPAATALWLYGMAGDASQAAHILLWEAGLEFARVEVNPHDLRTEHGGNFRDISACGQLPALEIASGAVISELPLILQHIADRVPGHGLLPAPADPSRTAAMAMLAFLSHVHRSLLSLFEPEPIAPEPTELAQLCRHVERLDTRLRDRPYLLGSRFTAADAYLFVVAGWLPFIGLGIQRWPALRAYRQRLAKRPSIVAARTAEGFDAA